MRLEAGVAGILPLNRVSFANIGCKCCAFFGASLLDPASVDSWTLKIRAHLSDAGCLDVIDKRVDLTVRQWLLDSGRVLNET